MKKFEKFTELLFGTWLFISLFVVLIGTFSQIHIIFSKISSLILRILISFDFYIFVPYAIYMMIVNPKHTLYIRKLFWAFNLPLAFIIVLLNTFKFPNSTYYSAWIFVFMIGITIQIAHEDRESNYYKE